MYYAILYLTLINKDSKSNRILIRGTIARFKEMGFLVTEIIINEEGQNNYLKFRETLRYAKRKRVNYVLSFRREMIHTDFKELFSLLLEAECLDIILITSIDGDLRNIRSKYFDVLDAGVKDYV